MVRNHLYLNADYTNETQSGMDDVVQMPGHFPLSLPCKRSIDDDRERGLEMGQRKVRVIATQPRNIQDLMDEVRV